MTGYDQNIEQSELIKRDLPVLSVDYFKTIAPHFYKYKIQLNDVKAIDNNGLKQIDSDWAKRLAYGKERTMYELKFDFE